MIVGKTLKRTLKFVEKLPELPPSAGPTKDLINLDTGNTADVHVLAFRKKITQPENSYFSIWRRYVKLIPHHSFSLLYNNFTENFQS